MKNTIYRPPGARSKIGVWVAKIFCALLLLAFSVCGTVFPIRDMEHYNRASKNPVVVTATVTAHKAYDDEGDTDFYSKISYTVDGVLYENVTYEDKDTKDALTPIGRQVTVEVSPEDPGIRIQELLVSGRFLLFMLPGILVLPVCVIHWLIARQRSQVYERSTVDRDLKLTVLCRPGLYAWPLVGLGYGFMLWRYPAVTGQWLVYVVGICAALWLACLTRCIRDLRRIRDGAYRIQRDEVIKKEEGTDSDGDTTYRIYYGNGNQRWDIGVSWEKYFQTSEGDTVYSVYLPGGKEPLYYYEWSSRGD